MEALWIALATVVVFLIIVAVAAWSMWRRSDDAAKELAGRVAKLPLRSKLRLAFALIRDSRMPWVVRAIPAVLVFYLALPFDLIPDMIPVLGHLDDLLILGLGVGVLLRLTPRTLLEELVAEVEDEA